MLIEEKIKLIEPIMLLMHEILISGLDSVDTCKEIKSKKIISMMNDIFNFHSHAIARLFIYLDNFISLEEFPDEYRSFMLKFEGNTEEAISSEIEFLKKQLYSNFKFIEEIEA